MPIHISITADTAQEALLQMRGFCGAFVEGTVTVRGAELTVAELTPEKPKATRATKTKIEQEPDAVGPAEKQTTSSETPGTETASAASSASTSPSEPVTEASLRVRATAFAAKGGPAALVEMQKLAGAANGKMSEIVASPGAMTKLDILLSDAGF